MTKPDETHGSLPDQRAYDPGHEPDHHAASRVYEVFSRQKEGGPLIHAGSVTADSPDLALIYAREVYGRRGESLALWVAPRDAFQMLEDNDLLHPALDRSYRMVEGYRMREKLKGLKIEE